MTRAEVIIGGPGTGKSSVAQAFTTLLDNAGIEHGAFESEQLAWGTPLLAAIGAEERLVACLRAPGDVAAARVPAREAPRGRHGARYGRALG